MKTSSIIAIFAAGFLAACGSGSGTPSSTSRSASPTASALAGSMQLGLGGQGGVSEELLGADVITPLLGGNGLVGATLDGGSNGMLAGNLPGLSLIPAGALAPVTDVLAQAGSQVPALGVSGKDGLGQDLLGHDITGMLLGTQGSGLVVTLLSGGNAGQLGDIAPNGGAPLAPLGDVLANVIRGAQAHPSDGNLGALEPLVAPLIMSGIGDSGGGVGGLPLPLPELPLDDILPHAVPVVQGVTKILASPLLPNGETAYSVVFPVVFGSVAGIADKTLPLGEISKGLAGAMP